MLTLQVQLPQGCREAGLFQSWVADAQAATQVGSVCRGCWGPEALLRLGQGFSSLRKSDWRCTTALSPGPPPVGTTSWAGTVAAS